MLVMGTASTVEEAKQLEDAGVDAVVLQGAEAGGHRCTFAASFDAGMIGTLALVPQAADALRIPVVASGGIMDGRGIAAALALGADAAQADLIMTDAFAHASGVLLLAHTRRIRMFGTPPRRLMERHVETELDRLLRR